MPPLLLMCTFVCLFLFLSFCDVLQVHTESAAAATVTVCATVPLFLSLSVCVCTVSVLRACVRICVFALLCMFVIEISAKHGQAKHCPQTKRMFEPYGTSSSDHMECSNHEECVIHRKSSNHMDSYWCFQCPIVCMLLQTHARMSADRGNLGKNRCLAHLVPQMNSPYPELRAAALKAISNVRILCICA